MSYLLGLDGVKIDLLHPENTPLSMVTIAHSLSLQCRWLGHTRCMYSVAQHSLHVSALLEASHGTEAARQGLMHDAHEAYIGDVPPPMKELLGEAWAHLERIWERRVRVAFGVTVDPAMAEAIHYADLCALATENDRYMTPVNWWRPSEYPDDGPCFDAVPRGVHASTVAKQFLARASALGLV